MSLPRVCIVSEIFHPEDEGGQGKQAFELARELTRQGAGVSVVTRRNFHGSARHDVIDGVNITRLPPSGLLKGLGWAAIPRTLYFLAGLFWHLIRHRREYDVLLVQGVKGILIPIFAAAAFCDKAYVVKIDALAELEHALTPESLARMGMSQTSLLAKYWSRTRDLLLGRAAAAIAISTQIESELRRRFATQPMIARVPNGVALSAAAQGRSKCQLRGDLNLPEGDIVIYTGRLSRAKGLLTLVEAWAPIAKRHPHAHLVLVGGGDRSFDNCEPELRDQVAAAGLQPSVTFVGAVPDVTHYLAASDLFIQCSESEGFGMSLVEAMAAGLPCISTPVGVAPEIIVNEDNGWLAPIGDAPALTALLEQAIESRSRWRQMGERAREMVQSKFDFAAVAARYIELFERLIGSNSGEARRWIALEPLLRRAGVLALVCSGALVWMMLGGFDWALETASSIVSSDGAVTAAGKRRFAAWLSGSAIFAAAAGSLALALSRRRWRATLRASFEKDALAARGLTVPNPYSVLLASTGIALLVIGLWTLRAQMSPSVLLLFAKEGPLEHVTFLLELSASAVCAAAAFRWNPRIAPHSTAIRGLFALCGLGLFLVAMEEINWGQTLFGFATPASWAALNYQQETSLHNLIDRDGLNLLSRIVATAFGIGALATMLWTRRTTSALLGAIAPPTSLALLALAVTYAGTSLHPEVLELLLAVFFAFYSWRIYVAARSSSVGWQLRQADSDVPRVDTKRSWDTELLEYTHDAIIIWEMDGGGIAYWNRAAEQLYGYARSEAVGRVTHELLRTELAGGVSHLEVSLARFGVWVGELRHRARDGREVVVDARLAVLAQHSGRWLVLEVNRDLTDAKIAEFQREAAERQLNEWRGSRMPPLSGNAHNSR